MSTHTPGPWAYRRTTSGHFIAGDGENYGYLAEVRRCRTNQNVMADARLIAAAPELLEACEAAARLFDGGPLSVSREYAGDLALIRAAISKATGEA